jgi:phosphatidylglycerophosphatase GEP4
VKEEERDNREVEVEVEICGAMLGKLGQRFNLSGIVSTFDVVLKKPQLALPHLEASDTSSIDWASLKHLGFQGVVLDKDNTLTAPYQNSLWPSLTASIDSCKTVFDGRLAILSNSAGISPESHPSSVRPSVVLMFPLHKRRTTPHVHIFHAIILIRRI